MITEKRAEMMAGTAYGEMLQSKSVFDTNGDYFWRATQSMKVQQVTTQQQDRWSV
jgi:hypothetical protein